MIKEVLKALIGVGKFPEEPFQPTLGTILLFGFMLIGSFLLAIGSLFLMTSFFI